MVRTSVESFPWFSPLVSKEVLLTTLSSWLTTQTRTRETFSTPPESTQLLLSPGAGTVLFGDKTKTTRIRLVRLIESTLEDCSSLSNNHWNQHLSQHCLNSMTLTRLLNFVNIVEPYLSDVQAREVSMTSSLFVTKQTILLISLIIMSLGADIFLQPSKSINFITLTFVATRTGIDFSEVVSTV